ncbi:glutamate--cysteine ligase [Streptomyces sp. TLI_146]|uniref:carboxylate-amine ligase n=1 Tax=Streptomyces sp. TLI_146 TaxID=1938858 RepID=UPI000C7015CC|nr:glutamate--cysteine ligase [Streptomyces sp. TLI_146]PKV83581.1 carboxylate-amine ligase [Streptomyces sp. TLI_146]
MITFGVEEEYLLLDPATGHPVPRAEEVRAAAGLGPTVEAREVQSELLQAQVEVATPVCVALEEAGGHLLRLRHAVGAAAEELGCRLAAVAAAPVTGAAPMPVTDRPRYLAMQTSAGQLVDEQLINGMHVHVGVPDREVGVAVLNRIRVWLPTLLALSVNSPLWDGRETGFASWRTLVFSRWPVSGPPPRFADLDDYESRAKALMAAGAVLDSGQLYWHARLSERYPTVEVRCPDVQLRADDAVMLAGIVRALVATAIREQKDGKPAPECPDELLHAATWRAARDGLTGMLVDPAGQLRACGDILSDLTLHIGPALEANGDTREVNSLLHRLLRQGTGADRQLQAFAEGGIPAALDLITSQSLLA